MASKGPQSVGYDPVSLEASIQKIVTLQLCELQGDYLLDNFRDERNIGNTLEVDRVVRIVALFLKFLFATLQC